MNSFPFIYIAALPRTGSTLLSELFTNLPHSFIFNEPHLGKNYFATQAIDKSYLMQYGIDLDKFLRMRLIVAFAYRRLRWSGYRQDYMVRVVKRHLIPRLQTHIQQIGVKEIKHKGWENYVQHFPDMKVIMTGRDPRDLYLSLYEKWQRGSMVWQGEFNPDIVASVLMKEFQRQLSLKKSVDTICVKYEDLCSDENVVYEIKDFVGSPIPTLGKIGSFVANHPRRMMEHEIHQGHLTNKRIGRWRQEENERLIKDINRFQELMNEYGEFWGYDL